MDNHGRGTASNPHDPSPQIAATTASKDVVYFAKTNFRHQGKLFGIQRKDRRQHMYVIGKTGTGKSALLHNFISQDIMNGEGVCVVDPHGELVEGVLKMVPKSRLKDVVYFNPADMDYHVGFNVLELPDPRYKHLVASGLMGIFTKIWSNVWSARMEYILNNAILALLDTPNTTLLGIPRLLVDKEYRQVIISNLKDPVVKAFWVNEYEEWQDKFRSEAIAPIQNKVGQFLSTALVRNVVGQSRSTLDIFKLMNDQKIFLVNVSKGRIGEDNSALLGAMLITKIQLSAMERVRIPEDERRDFYLYVDEFQNFATDSFAGVLSEARKYRLNLIIAHQYVGQLVTDTSTKVRDAVFGNAGTMVIFRVGAADAEWLENELAPEFTIEDVVNIPNYNIYIKLMVNGITVRPFSASTLSPFKTQADAAGEEAIIKMSREKYGRPREVVEKEINRWASGGGFNDDEEGNDNAGEATKVANTGGKGEMFLSVCNNCGKEAKLPFKPTPGRPVYCSECLEKLQKGLIKPVKVIKKPSVEREAAGIAALAGIGIEFGAQKAAPRPERRDDSNRSSRPAGESGGRRDGGGRANNGGRNDNRNQKPPQNNQKGEVSLSALKSDDAKQARIKENDPKKVEAMKEELKKTLGQ
jgi:CxxC-x17-CxxC domain-containing protein